MGENEQLVPVIPGTDLGGHDTAGVDGEVRTERKGEILGTPNPDNDTRKHTEEGREREEAKHDYVREAVDRNNREVLPKLGGNIDDGWEPDGKKAKVEVPDGIETGTGHKTETSHKTEIRKP